MINVVYYDLPIGVHGMCRENDDASYTIVLNSRDNEEANRHTYLHEMDHISRGHFSDTTIVDTVEEK